MRLPWVSPHASKRFREYVRNCDEITAIRSIHYGMRTGSLLRENSTGEKFYLATYKLRGTEKKVIIVSRKNQDNIEGHTDYVIVTIEEYDHYLSNNNHITNKISGNIPKITIHKKKPIIKERQYNYKKNIISTILECEGKRDIYEFKRRKNVSGDT